MVYLKISNGSVFQMIINWRIIEMFLAMKNYYYDRKVIIIVRKNATDIVTTKSLPRSLK